jgi:hypothetical protein
MGEFPPSKKGTEKEGVFGFKSRINIAIAPEELSIPE